ncbi:MAG: thioredoxin family protein, partial [Odoribacter sp.]|nr:thioredoxin family protein [Odoribacter sp.]
MKYIYLLLFCLLAGYTTFAQEGVNFRNITLEEAQEQAKAENKLVFMDCYTSWCGPCKNMTEKVFPQKAAGDYFNPRFVCVKYDMEKGAG